MFVVFEGIDGSGKTTVSNLVVERLQSAGLSVKHLRADGKFVSSVSEAIRDLGRDSRNLELVPQAEFLLYVARDVQLIEEALRPALGQFDVVLADRFLYTAQNLGAQGRHLPESFTAPILAAVAGGLRPDLVVLVDVDPVLARARRKAHKLAVLDRRPPSRKGLAGVGLQHRLRRGYLELAAAAPERWVVVGNENVLEETVSRVAELIVTAARDDVATAIAAFRRATPVAARAVARSALPSVEQSLEHFLTWVDARMVREPRVAAYMLSGMWGTRIDERRRALATRVPEAVLSALSGQRDDVSWSLRDQASRAHPRAVARSLSGIPNSEAAAWALRQRLEADATEEVLASISHFDDPATWDLREKYAADYPSLILGTLSGLGSERAWALRNAWLEVHKGKLEVDYEAGRLAAKSVSNLGDERAWHLRERARRAAPVAALASIGRLDDARSWQWRQDHLFRAPKVVMGTLRRSDHPQAWLLRAAIFADCKEALDSIQGLDGPAAWRLREHCADLWPSTVVKTLGPLADSPQGQALIGRQLGAHADNISLLKHVSSVALGLHRVQLPEDD